MTTARVPALSLLPGALGCGHTPRAYTFDTHQNEEDTGYRFRETQGLEHETTIFLRYQKALDKLGQHLSGTLASSQRTPPAGG